MVDLFAVEEDNKNSSNKFLQRALHGTSSADHHNQMTIQELQHLNNSNNGESIYQSALKERNLIDSIIMPSSNRQLLSAEQMRSAPYQDMSEQ